MSRTLHVIFLMYPWVLTIGNFPSEILVILTKYSFSVLRVIYHGKKNSV